MPRRVDYDRVAGVYDTRYETNRLEGVSAFTNLPRRADKAAGHRLLVGRRLRFTDRRARLPVCPLQRTRAAARYVSGRMFHARTEAVKRSRRVGYQFRAAAGDWAFAAYNDENGNGIRSTDIERGTDPMLWPAESLSARFRQVSFGIVPGTPLIDGESSSDPIRVGSADIVTFDPNGSSSSGTLYVRGSRGAQYAVRIFGVTGRTRMFKYDLGTLSWKEQ